MRYVKELFCFTAIGILIVLSVVLPPSGETALLNELCDILIIWVAVIYIILKIIKSRKAEKTKIISSKIVKIAVAAALVSAGILFSSSLTADMLSGPKTVILYEPEVSSRQGHTGIFSLHYYLSGEDENGTVHRMEISGDEYQSAQRENKHEITVQYYERTKRLFRYW